MTDFPIMPAAEDRRIPAPIRTTRIPWAAIAPHAAQAQRNHGGQTLERLAERGGLSAREALAVLLDREWKDIAEEDPIRVQQALLTEVLRWAQSQFAEPGGSIPDSGKGYVHPATAGARAESDVVRRENRYFLEDSEVSRAEYERRTDSRTPINPKGTP